jgi:type II secretory pathway predicted ATPase ExeA
MFLNYFGLREQPFGTTPDPRLLYLSASHREALASLIYGIETGRGFLALIAEPGMGKTTLLFQLMERLRNSARTVFLFQTQCTTREFLCNLIADLGLDPGDQDVSSLQRQLNEILIREAQMGRQFVLVIDEAQNLEDSVLESVRMLSNFETPRSKLMQIVLSGQPQLADKLARADLEQLRQRVSVICRLDPFTQEQVVQYVEHRLEAAGYSGSSLFTPEALSLLADHSGGNPRNINNICFHALSLGYAKSQKRIDRPIIEEVLSDLNLESLGVQVQRPKPRHQSPALDDRRFDLGRVAINRSSEAEARKSTFPSGVHTFPPSYAENRIRRNPAKDRSSRWLIWAVVLPAIILVAEMFWAYLPPDSSREAVAKSVAAAVHEVKTIAVKHNPLNSAATDGTQAVTEPQKQIPDSLDGNSGQVPQAAPSEAPVPADSGAGSQSSAVPSDENAPDIEEDSGMPVKTQEPSSTAQKPDKQVPDNSAPDDFGPSSSGVKARIAIESNINAGQITINGKTKPDWLTPHIFSLPLGTYRISVTKPGYATWFSDVQVSKTSGKWIVAHLNLPRGVIVIDTEPPGMQVFIDGKSYGPSEVETALSVGAHSYEVIPPAGHQPVSGSFVLKPGDILTRKISVVPAAGTPDAENRAGSLPPGHRTYGATGGVNLEQEF